MKETGKKEIKKSAVKGGITAAGAVLGAVLKETVLPETAEGQEAEVMDAEMNAEPVAEAAAIPLSPADAEIDTVTEVEVVAAPSTTAETTASHKDYASVEATVEATPESAEEVVAEPASGADEDIIAEVSTEETVEVIESTPSEDLAELEGIDIVSIEGSGVDGSDMAAVDTETAGYDAPTLNDMPDYMANVDYTQQAIDENLFAENNMDQDYLASRVDDYGLGNTDLAQDIPDYVNDANIDSFMGMA